MHTSHECLNSGSWLNPVKFYVVSLDTPHVLQTKATCSTEHCYVKTCCSKICSKIFIFVEL